MYIGITAQSVNIRWRKGNGYRHSPHFTAAIKKYGWDNIKHEILFDGLTQAEAESKEIELIKLYKSTDRKHGYNCDSGGNANRCHSEETKEKIRNAHIGMKHTEDFSKKLSERNKGNKYRLGKHLSEESKNKISEKNKGRFAGEKNFFYGKRFCGKDNHNSKPVERYTLNGEYIDERECASQYAKELGKINGSPITRVCRGQRRSYLGYIWKYKEVKSNELV